MRPLSLDTFGAKLAHGTAVIFRSVVVFAGARPPA